MIVKDYNFQQFLENIPTEKKIFLLHGTLISKIWNYRKLLELKLVGPKALQQMKLVLVDKSNIQKDKNNLSKSVDFTNFFNLSIDEYKQKLEDYNKSNNYPNIDK